MIKKYGRYIGCMKDLAFRPARVRALPVHLILETTTVCPFNCIMCSRAKEVADPHHMEFGFFSRILDEVAPLHLYLSSAGEPLLHPETPRMVRHSKEKGIKTCLVTSLAAAAFPIGDLVNSGLDLLKISVDGATENTYRKVRGTDFFPRVVKTIGEIAEIKKKRGVERPYMRFQFVVQKENYKEAPALVRLADSLGVGAVYFKPLEVLRIEERVGDLMGGVGYDEMRESLAEARAVSRSLGVKTNLDDFLSYQLRMRWPLYEGNGLPAPLSRTCIVPWFSTYVRIHGDVAFCCYAKVEDARVGAMREGDFRSIWSGEKYSRMRRALRAGEFPLPDCGHCVPQRLAHLVDYRRIIPGYGR